MIKTITANDTYKAEDEPVEQGEPKYDGYSQVTVQVPTYKDEYDAMLECFDDMADVIEDATGEKPEDCQEAIAAVQGIIEDLDTMKSGFDEKVEHLKQLTGITATTFAELDDIINEVAQNSPKPPGVIVETPVTKGVVEETEEENPATQSEIDDDAHDINDENGEPDVTDTEQEGGGNPNNIRSYFGIKGLGWYSLRIDKNNTFWVRDSSYYAGFAMFGTTSVRIIVTKFDENGDEHIVSNFTAEADSYGNYNYPYDPEYNGHEERPGTLKYWNGNYDSPNILYYRYNNELHIRTRTWSMAGSTINDQWNYYTITLT